MGRRWHFFFAWLLVLNGLVYVADLFVARHWRDLVPTRADLQAIPRAILDHARLRFPKGDEALRYNVLQKLAYLSVVIAFPVLVLAGLTMSPAMDAAFPWLIHAVPRAPVGADHPLPPRGLPRRLRRRPPRDGAAVGRRQQHALDDHRPLPHPGGKRNEPRASLEPPLDPARLRGRRPPAACRLQPRFPLARRDGRPRQGRGADQGGAARPARAAPGARPRISAGRDHPHVQAERLDRSRRSGLRRACARADSPTGGSRSAAWSSGR